MDVEIGSSHTGHMMCATTPGEGSEFLRLVPSGEIYLKSRRTREKFMRALVSNVRDGLKGSKIDAVVRRSGYHELSIETVHFEGASRVASKTFGVNRVERVIPMAFDSLGQLSKIVAEIFREQVRDRRFAVRMKRRGSHGWTSRDAEVEIGNLLFAESSGVDLTNPEVTVRVYVNDAQALVVNESYSGPDGLPCGTQRRVLALVSGGIDSPVAAWMLMRRGCSIDYLHLKIDCSVSDHALVVADTLDRQWGHGVKSRFHVVDFQPIKEQLRDRVAPRDRQVVLKQLMLAAGAEVARRSDIELMVTGDSLGQVSSQTAAHLAQIDSFVGFPTLRPLVGMTKEEIIIRSRSIGLYDLSIRAREVCDLSEGRPVETAASAIRLDSAHRKLDDDTLDMALKSWESIDTREWAPGVSLVPAALDPRFADG